MQESNRGGGAVRARVLPWLLGLLAGLAAAQDPGAWQALREQRVPGAPQALAYVDVLHDAGQADRAELLRLGALAAHLALLNGAPAPAGGLRLGTLIDDGTALPAPGRDTPQAQAWQAAFNRHVQLQWHLPPAGLPPELAYLQAQLQPLAPGAWRMSASGQDRYLAIVQLRNRSPTALPLTAFWLRLGHAAQVLDLDCAPPVEREAINGRPGAVLADPGERVPPGGQRPFICRAVAEPAWREVLARAATGSPAAGDSLQLLPRHFDNPQDVVALTAAMADPGAVDRAAWARRFAAEAQAGRTAQAAGTRAPPAADASAPTRRAVYMALAALLAALLLGLRMGMARLNGSDTGEALFRSLRLGGVLVLGAAVLATDWAQRLLGAVSDRSAQATIAAVRRAAPLVEPAAPHGNRGAGLGALVQSVGLGGAAAIATLVLFVAGRGLRRLGWSAGMVRAATGLTLFLGTMATVAGTWESPSGEGWGRAVPLIMVIVIMGLAMAIFVTLQVLDALHGLLDAAQLSWPASIGQALRHSLNFSGQASRAEFWGYTAFFALAWGLTRLHAPAWNLPLTLLLALPMAALAVRRLRAMDAHETWTVVGVITVVALEIWL